MNRKDTYNFENCCSTCTGDAKDNLKQRILDMGFKEVQISLAIKRCGLRSCSGEEGCFCLQDSIYPLVDFINAHLDDNEERELLDSSTQNSEVCSKKQLLSDMGYEMNEVCHAIEICGDDSDFEVLVDFIYATYGYKKENKVLDFNVDVMKPGSSSGMSKESNVLDFNVVVMKPESSSGWHNINTASDSKTTDENYHKWSSTSSESSEDGEQIRREVITQPKSKKGVEGFRSF